MAKLIKSNEKTKPINTTLSIGALSCTIEFNGTFTDLQVINIKSKMVMAMSEALSNIQ